MTRVFNFSAGPAALPESVLRQAADEMLDWHGSGMSVMEMSHRGKEFIAIHAEAEALLRELLAMPANYKVLFMQGGAIGENAIVPMNLLRGTRQRRLHQHRRVVEEVDQGSEQVRARSTSPPAPRRSGFTRVPPRDDLAARPGCRLRAHLLQRDHRRRRIPLDARHRRRAAGGRHVVATSCRARSTCSRYGLIYAGAQKNIGPAGPDDRDRARRPARPGAADHAVGLRLQAAGRQRLDAQHAAHLRDLHRRAGVQVDQGARRAGGDGSAQPRQGRAAVRLPRRQRLLQQPGGARGPLADERAVHAARRGAGRGLPEGRRRRAA